MRTLRSGLLIAFFSAAATRADVRFEVAVPEGVLDAPSDGRLLVYLVGPDRRLHEGEQPAQWDFWHEPMPLYATDVKQLVGGTRVIVDGKADHLLTSLDALKPGSYTAQAVFDWHRDASGWQLEPGNLFSRVVHFETHANVPRVVDLTLDNVVSEPTFDNRRVAKVEVRSKLLSDFRGRDVMLRAGIALPLGYDPTKKYAAIYEIPGFGGTHADALDAARERAFLAGKPPSAKQSLARRAFHIFLDPESPNGHTLFADSDVNGPVGRALVEELIPAIEHQFPALVGDPWARMLAGHSSGGWSACWLQTRFDETFGGAWASSPDPLDFRMFEKIDLYAWDNLYTHEAVDAPSVRDEKGVTTMTVRQENALEQVIGPDNRGGQQWQSWQAVFGLPRGDGTPRPLYDIVTGVIDHSQIAHYAKYDQRALLHDDPKRLSPIWREKIRVIVGDADDYWLDAGVKAIAAELAALPPTGTVETNRGYLKIVPGKTHDTIYETPEMDAFDREMLEQIESHLK